MRFRKDKCSQTRGMLSAYIDQQLGLQEQEGVEKHLKACQGCQQELDSLRATVQLLHRVPQVSPARSFAVTEPKPLPRWSPFPVLRTATAVVAAFLVLVFALDAVNVFETGPTSVEEGRTYSGERAPEEKGPGSEPSTAATEPVVVFTPDQDDWVIEIQGEAELVAAAMEGEMAQEGGTPSEEKLGMDELHDLLSSQKTATYGAEPDGEDVVVSYDRLDMEELDRVVEPENGAAHEAESDEENVVVPYGRLDMEELGRLAESQREAAQEDVTDGDEETAAATGEGTLGEEEAGWVRPLEYGLLGVVVVFAGATVAGWRKKKLKVG